MLENRRKTLLLFLALFLGGPAHSSRLSSCFETLAIIFGSPAIHRQRVKLFLPEVVKAASDYYAAIKDTTPESLSGLTQEEAVNRLKDPYSKGNPTSGMTKHTNPQMGHSVSFINRTEFKLVIKKNAPRRPTVPDALSVAQISNNVRAEVLAYMLDRHLGTHLVSPAVMLGNDQVAILYTPGKPMNFNQLNDPKFLVDLTHIRFLDLLLENPERESPGNVVLGDHGRPVAIDFDMAKPDLRDRGSRRPLQYVTDWMLLEPQTKWWLGLRRYGPISGVASIEVIKKIQALNSEILKKMAREQGLELTEIEIENILKGKNVILQSLEEWKRNFGVNAIEASQDPS